MGARFRFTVHEAYGRLYQVSPDPDSGVGGQAGGWEVTFDGTSDTIRVYHNAGGGTGARVALSPDTWYFVVTVVDGDDATLYVYDRNGQISGSPGTGSRPRTQTGSEPLYLMNADQSETAGKMEEVFGFSTALSASEVDALYNNSF